MPAPPRSVESHIVAYLHDGCPEVHSLGSDRAVPELLEPANLLRGSLDVVGVLGDALVGATLSEAHVGVDLTGGHLGAERPDTEAGGHVGRFVVSGEYSTVGEVSLWTASFNGRW